MDGWKTHLIFKRNKNTCWNKEVAATSLMVCVTENCRFEIRAPKLQHAGVSLSPGAAVLICPLSVPDASDGLDLWSLTVRAPVPPVLVVSTVPLTLHDVLLADRKSVV